MEMYKGRGIIFSNFEMVLQTPHSVFQGSSRPFQTLYQGIYL